MSAWNKEQLENMLEDVVNALDLSDTAIEKHGPEGTAPATLVRLVLEQKDREISLLRRGFVDVSKPAESARRGCNISNLVCSCVLADRCTLGDVCHSRMFHSDDVPECFTVTVSESPGDSNSTVKEPL
jgi:hypothetical protein